MDRRQLFRNAFGLVGAATLAPSILNETLPTEGAATRCLVEIFERESLIADGRYATAG